MLTTEFKAPPIHTPSGCIYHQSQSHYTFTTVILSDILQNMLKSYYYQLYTQLKMELLASQSTNNQVKTTANVKYLLGYLVTSF